MKAFDQFEPINSICKAEDKFPEFYKGSALTFTGIICEEAPLYLNFLKENGIEIDEKVTCYFTEGRYMNMYYDLKGDVAYPDNLHFLIIPLKAFKDGQIGKLALLRLQVDGRWFDDIVDNNERHMKGE